MRRIIHPYDRMMRRVVPVTESGCWIYTGNWNAQGYGTVSTTKGQAPSRAHRIALERKIGEIPFGLDVCHRCDTPCCVNPDHLFPGTRSENMKDCFAKKRNNPKSILNLRPGGKGFIGAAPSKENK